MESTQPQHAARAADSNYELQKWKMLQLRQESLEEEAAGIGMEGQTAVGRRQADIAPEDIARKIMVGPQDDVVRRQVSMGLDAQELDHEFLDNSREVYFYFFVNRGSGGRMAHLLLDMDVDEIKFPNYISKKDFPNLTTIRVKVVPLNDAEMRMKRFREVKALSERARRELTVTLR